MNPFWIILCLLGVNSFCVQQSPIATDQFLERAIVGSRDFVITWEKLGLPYADWSVREDVVFDANHSDEPNYLGSRGYEFRYNLHPAQYYQEFHTTINVYSTPTLPAALGSRTVLVNYVDLGHGVIGYISQAADGANTIRIDFAAGNYQVNVKLKYSTSEIAIPLLVQSGQVIVAELYP